MLPRTVAGLNESTGWNPASPRGVRQFGEVMLDELVLSGFSLLGESPSTVRSPDACGAAADELSALGIDGAHADPQPLQVETINSRRIAGLRYERLTFEHDPALPESLATERLGGPARAVVHLCRHPGGVNQPGWRRRAPQAPRHRPRAEARRRRRVASRPRAAQAARTSPAHRRIQSPVSGGASRRRAAKQPVPAPRARTTTSAGSEAARSDRSRHGRVGGS